MRRCTLVLPVIACCLLAGCQTPQMHTSVVAQEPTVALSAGAAEVRITPTQDRELVHQDLYARSLVLSDGSNKLVMITYDGNWFGLGDTDEIRKGVSARLGIPVHHVIINSSHTHSSPWPDREAEWKDGLTYRRWLIKAVIDICAGADNKLRPCAIRYGRQEIQIGFNRRQTWPSGTVFMAVNPDGPVVPWTDIVGVYDTETDQRIALLFTYAAHPVITQHSGAVSSDFPGSAVAQLQEWLGNDGRSPGVLMFGQGCGADINAFPLRGGTQACDAVGGILAGSLIRAELKEVPPGELRAASVALKLPYQSPPTVEQVKQAMVDMKNQPHESYLPKLLKTAEAGEMERILEYPITAMAIGPALCILALPYETFCEYQLFADEESPFAHTLTLGYCERGLYVATAADYELMEQGGYEAGTYGSPLYGEHGLALDPSIENTIREGIVQLLTTVKGK